MSESKADMAEQAAARLETALERIASRLAAPDPSRNVSAGSPELMRRLDRLIDRLRTEID